ncbi:hypothetical protein [Variovorax sp. PAMC26660]|uniref:hypothetical protein n=1 Tax=Variovorax sp. PAMC26660 TaxID=2762322 RepID=UPI00164D2B49|nr:hypothetical protein [Variovorax sp. PAMC26660]QNK71206.1 hypothetical protein H7F35_16660 [Variovorax sp. PAMC26660]
MDVEECLADTFADKWEIWQKIVAEKSTNEQKNHLVRDLCQFEESTLTCRVLHDGVVSTEQFLVEKKRDRAPHPKPEEEPLARTD